MKKNNKIVKKSTLIERVKKSVFIWVALASVIVAASVMVLIVLFRVGMFNNKVSIELSKTQKQLKENRESVRLLKGSLKELNTDENLKSIRSSDDAKPIQTILDALPTEDNRLALGSSIQRKFLEGMDGIKVESISLENEESENTDSSSGEFGMQNVSMSISGQPDKIQELLKKFEKSIRAVDVTNLNGSASEEGDLTVQITAQLPYLAPIEVQLKDKKIEDK